MQVDLLGAHDEHRRRQPAAHGKPLPQVIVVVDRDRAVDAQGLIDAGNHEDHGRAGTLHQVGQRVDAVVARSIRDQQRVVVVHLYEARVVTSR